MTILTMRRAMATDNAAIQFDTFHDSLPAGFDPIIAPALLTQIKRLGLSTGITIARRPNPGAGEETVAAEVIRHRDALFVVALEQTSRLSAEEEWERGEPRIIIYAACQTVDPPALDELDACASQHFGVTFDRYRYATSRFNELKAEATVAATDPAADDFRRAHVLADRVIRTLATAVKTSGGLLVTDVAKQVPGAATEQVDAARTALVDNDIIGSEIVVVCKKTQTQVVRAPNRETLAKMATIGGKCGCGRLYTDERVEEALTITDAGRELLDGSRWMSLLLLEQLESVGIPRDRILVEAVLGGDELDCLADLNGELALFELKDKEFSLGEAYSFGAKIGLVRPRHSMVVTSETVGPDVVEHFRRTGEAGRARSFFGNERTEPMRYVQGLDNLGGEIAKLATSVYSRDFLTALRSALDFAVLNPRVAVQAVPGREEPVASPATPEPTRRTVARTRRAHPKS